MSGPKSSRYVLTEAQRRAIQEELRRIREAQILEEKKKREIEIIKINCNQLKAEMDQLQNYIDQINVFTKEGQKSSLDFDHLEKKFISIKNEISKSEKIGIDKELEYLSKQNNIIAGLLNDIRYDNQDAENDLVQIKGKYRDELIEKISNGFSISFAKISNNRSIKENPVYKRIVEELESIAGIEISDELKTRFEAVQKKANEIDSVDFLQNFLSITLLPFVKDCKEYDRLEKEFGEDYRNLLLRYEFLTQKLNHEKEIIPFSNNAISILLSRIAELEEEELKNKEEEYICQCINEAMQEMNYSVVGNRNVEKKNGKKFKSVLYEFDEGTAVNVTYSSDGQITMELGGISTEDRIPTEAESLSLEEDMRSFCDDFYEIEKKLKAKGIESKHISHLPPEAQFAQIINVSDFEMNSNVSSYVAKKDRKKIGTEQTRLHKDI